MAETKGLNTKEGSSSLKSQDPDDEAPDSAMEESASGATETGKGKAQYAYLMFWLSWSIICWGLSAYHPFLGRRGVSSKVTYALYVVLLILESLVGSKQYCRMEF